MQRVSGGDQSAAPLRRCRPSASCHARRWRTATAPSLGSAQARRDQLSCSSHDRNEAWNSGTCVCARCRRLRGPAQVSPAGTTTGPVRRYSLGLPVSRVGGDTPVRKSACHVPTAALVPGFRGSARPVPHDARCVGLVLAPVHVNLQLWRRRRAKSANSAELASRSTGRRSV